MTLRRPTVRLIAPLLVLLFPVAWFARRAATGPTTVADLGPVVVGAVALGLASAVVLARVDAPDSTSPTRRARWLAREVVEPSRRTLAALAAELAAVVGYLTVTLVVPAPAWVDGLLAPAGLVLAAPLLVCYGGLIAASNAFATTPPWSVEVGAVVVGTSLSAVWALVLAAALARIGTGIAERAN